MNSYVVTHLLLACFCLLSSIANLSIQGRSIPPQWLFLRFLSCLFVCFIFLSFSSPGFLGLRAEGLTSVCMYLFLNTQWDNYNPVFCDFGTLGQAYNHISRKPQWRRVKVCTWDKSEKWWVRSINNKTLNLINDEKQALDQEIIERLTEKTERERL